MNEVYSDGFVDLGVKKDLSALLEGWWVQGAISYNLALTQEIDRSKDFETFEMLLDPGTGDTTYNRFGTKSDQRNNSSILARSHQLYAAGSTGFSRNWGEHSLDALLMYNIDSYSIDSDLPNRYQTLAARLRYNIGNKYLLEAAASYSGNNRYEEGNRFGLFPAFRSEEHTYELQ